MPTKSKKSPIDDSSTDHLKPTTCPTTQTHSQPANKQEERIYLPLNQRLAKQISRQSKLLAKHRKSMNGNENGMWDREPAFGNSSPKTAASYTAKQIIQDRTPDEGFSEKLTFQEQPVSSESKNDAVPAWYQPQVPRQNSNPTSPTDGKPKTLDLSSYLRQTASPDKAGIVKGEHAKLANSKDSSADLDDLLDGIEQVSLSSDASSEITSSQQDLWMLHNKMVEERKKEQELASREKQRLDEIINICALYQQEIENTGSIERKSSQSSVAQHTTPLSSSSGYQGVPMSDSRNSMCGIKTNGSLTKLSRSSLVQAPSYDNHNYSDSSNEDVFNSSVDREDEEDALFRAHEERFRALSEDRLPTLHDTMTQDSLAQHRRDVQSLSDDLLLDDVGSVRRREVHFEQRYTPPFPRVSQLPALLVDNPDICDGGADDDDARTESSDSFTRQLYLLQREVTDGAYYGADTEHERTCYITDRDAMHDDGHYRPARGGYMDRETSISSEDDYLDKTTSTSDAMINGFYDLDYLDESEEIAALRLEDRRRLKLEKRLLEESMRRDELMNEEVHLRGQRKLQTRPLTRYLPITSQELDLREHIETAGHHVETCPYVTIDESTCKGYLLKMASRFRKWNRRWFVFDRRHRALFYFHKRETAQRHEKLSSSGSAGAGGSMERSTRGGAHLASCAGVVTSDKYRRGAIYFQAIQEVYVDHLHQVKSPSRHLTFCLKTQDRMYYLGAPSPEAMRIWVDVICTGAEAFHQYT